MASTSKFLDQTGLTYLWNKINAAFVPQTRTVNSKALSSDISLSYTDVSAAPTSHASSSTTYGIGTTDNYGHVKTAENLTTSQATDGLALGAYQGKILQGEIDTLNSDLIAETAELDASKVSKTGDSMTGDLNLSNANIIIQEPIMDVTASGISATQTASFAVIDKNNVYTSWYDTSQDTNGTMRLSLVLRSRTSGSDVTNGIYLVIQPDGTRTVSVGNSEAAKAAWRSAIGVSAIHSKTVTGTTDANGFINLSLPNGSYIPLVARSNATDNHVEFTTGSTSWWGRVTYKGAARTNTSVTIDLYYTDKP